MHTAEVLHSMGTREEADTFYKICQTFRDYEDRWKNPLDYIDEYLEEKCQETSKDSPSC